MKKIILSAFLLGAMLVTKNTMAQITFGPKAALNISTIHEKQNSNPYAYNYNTNRISFQAGLIMNVRLLDYVSIRPELTYNSVGAIATSSNNLYKLTSITNYLYLPLNIVGQYPLKDNFKLQAFFGPYAALGLNGKFVFETPTGTGSDKVNMKKNPSDGYMEFAPLKYYQNPWDFGLNFGVGFQARSFVFSASYALGLSNTQAHYSNDADEANRDNLIRTSNRTISFGIACLFGGK